MYKENKGRRNGPQGISILKREKDEDEAAVETKKERLVRWKEIGEYGVLEAN